MLLIYYLVALLLVYAAIEYFVVHKEHSYEQRLLPLVLGLAVVYIFYLIVDYITGASAVFNILKDLLLLQLVYLIFYYIIDFTHIMLPFWLNMICFAGIGIGNVTLCFMIYSGGNYHPIVYSIVILYDAIAIVIGGLTIHRRSKLHKVHIIYKLLYFGLMVPTLSIALAEIGLVEEKIIVPAGISFFCVIIIYLMVSGMFYETGQYIKDDFFRGYDGNLMLFDADMCYIDSSHGIKEMFPEDIEMMATHPNSYPLRETLKKWSLDIDKVQYERIGGKYYRCKMKPVTKNNAIRGFIVYIYDVTNEKKETEDALKQTRQKSEFLANMSHELRSPLNAIIGGSDVILDKKDLSETSRVMVSRISNAGRQLLDIVNSILDYSKLEIGNLELQEKTYSLKEVIEKIAYDTASAVKGRKITLKIKSVDPVPRVLIGDRNRINVIIKNILYNATSTTIQGAIECTINTEFIDDENVKITFKCKDQGPGMTEEDMKNVFEKFESFSEQTIAESTGIGLYLAGQLSRMMQGEASVYSDGEHGTEITVSFVQKAGSKECIKPFSVSEAILTSDYEAAQDQAKPQWIYPTANVLVVDDMKVNREIFEARASKWKINILEAESGQEAIEMAKANDIDLIMMDQMMPNMSGLEAYEEIKKFSSVPTVLLTANTSDGLVSECERRGFAGYMAKPIKLTVLKRMLENNLPEEKREKFADNAFNAAEEREYDPNFVYVLEAYIEDVSEILPKLWDYFNEDLDMFRVKVHGIKGISRQIGKQPISESAEVMEMAAKASHKDFIARHLDAFIADLNVVLSETKDEYEAMAKDM